MCQVLDQSVFPTGWTSRRLLRETIYFEDKTHRFELRRYPVTHPNFKKNGNYCLSIIKPEVITDQRSFRSLDIPLKECYVVPLYDQISW